MSVLPAQIDAVNLQTKVTFVDYPTNTYYVDPISKQIRGMADGSLAMLQAVQIHLSVERYFFQIYTPNFGFETKGLIGQDYNYIVSEIPRRVNDAFKPDKRILGTKDYTFEWADTDVLVCTFTAITVYGNVTSRLEVQVNA